MEIIKNYVPPEKTNVDRIREERDLIDKVTDIAEGVLKFVEEKEDDNGNIIRMTIEVPFDPPEDDD